MITDRLNGRLWPGAEVQVGASNGRRCTPAVQASYRIAEREGPILLALFHR
jgi:hypothetical protein